MAKTLEIPIYQDVSCTAKLFAIGSDTVVETIVLSEATNRKGIATGTIASATGWNRAIVFNGSTAIGDFVVYVGSTDPATYQAVDDVAIDWAKIQNATSTVGLTGTTISTSQQIASVSGAVGSVTGAVGSVTGAVGSVTGNVGGNVVGTVGSVTGSVGSVVGAVGSVAGNVAGNVLGSVATIGGGGIAAASFVAGAIDAAAIATDAFGALELAAGAASEIATAVRTELATELARVDATISSRLAPTVSGRTLDVTTTGEAGIDWANVGSATATVGLTNTTVGTVSAATIGAGGITSSTFAAGAIDANAIATDAIGALELAAGAASEVASAVRTELATELGRIDAAVTSRMAGYTQPTGFLTTEFGATVATTANVSAVETDTQDIQARLPAALTSGGNMKSDVLKVNGQATSFVQKNAALASFPFLMTESTYHLPATGKTVTVTRSIDGGAFASGTLSAVSELSNGVYLVSFGAGDLNGTTILLRATATGCDDTFERIVTQP